MASLAPRGSTAQQYRNHQSSMELRESSDAKLQTVIQLVDKVQINYAQQFPETPQIVKRSCGSMFNNIKSCLTASNHLKRLFLLIDALDIKTDEKRGLKAEVHGANGAVTDIGLNVLKTLSSFQDHLHNQRLALNHVEYITSPKSLSACDHPPTFEDEIEEEELEVIVEEFPPRYNWQPSLLDMKNHRLILQRIDEIQRQAEESLVTAPPLIRQTALSSWSDFRSIFEDKFNFSKAPEEFHQVDGIPAVKERLSGNNKTADDQFEEIGAHSAQMIQRITNDFKRECASIAPAGLLALPEFKRSLNSRSRKKRMWKKKQVSSSSSSQSQPRAPKLSQSDFPPLSGTKLHLPISEDLVPEKDLQTKIRAAEVHNNTLNRIKDLSSHYASSLPSGHPEKVAAGKFASKTKEILSWVSTFNHCLSVCSLASSKSSMTVWDFFLK